MNRITDSDIDEMRARGDDPHAIAEAEIDRDRTLRADLICRSIEAAFAGVILGEGIGLWEAQGIDDCTSLDVCSRYRARDERADWYRIPIEDLNYCIDSPCFMDAEGFRFHLPAFMVAQLRGDLVYDFSTALIDLERLKHDRYVLLSSNQRASVREYLMFLRDLPDCDYSLTMPDQSGIERALLDYWTLDSCES